MFSCVLCESDNTEILYKPHKSAVSLRIGICKNCSLVQAIYDQIKYEKINEKHWPDGVVIEKLSCDADYSEVRVGKQQMAHKPFAHFDRYLRDKKSITHILDMRSARGNFALRAIDYFEIPSIDCIESDYYMTESYRNNPKINLICSKYYEHKPPKPYDLVIPVIL